jgi:hypothetical protein
VAESKWLDLAAIGSTPVLIAGSSSCRIWLKLGSNSYRSVNTDMLVFGCPNRADGSPGFTAYHRVLHLIDGPQGFPIT